MLARALRAGLVASAADVRADLAATLPARTGARRHLGDQLPPARPARHWLQASNPWERLKWDHMFHDLPPVKFADTIARKPARDIIPVTKID